MKFRSTLAGLGLAAAVAGCLSLGTCDTRVRTDSRAVFDFRNQDYGTKIMEITDPKTQDRRYLTATRYICLEDPNRPDIIVVTDLTRYPCDPEVPLPNKNEWASMLARGTLADTKVYLTQEALRAGLGGKFYSFQVFPGLGKKRDKMPLEAWFDSEVSSKFPRILSPGREEDEIVRGAPYVLLNPSYSKSEMHRIMDDPTSLLSQVYKPLIFTPARLE